MAGEPNPLRGGYCHPEIADLAVQMRHTPPRLLGKHLEGLERLLSRIEPPKEYPFDWVRYAITGYDGRGSPSADRAGDGNGRPTAARLTVFPGKTLLADLNRLTWEFAQPASAAEEPVYTLAEVAERLGVSEKTVTRWRRRGLPARPWAYPDGRIRVGIRHAELTGFLERHGDQVARAAGLTRLTYEETQQLLAMARGLHAEMRASGTAPTVYQVAKTVAERVDRAVETVRYTLYKHDEHNPEEAVFPELLPPLSDAVQIAVWERAGQGEPLEALRREFRRPRSVIEAAVANGRVLAILKTPVAFIDNPEFRDAAADAVIRREAEEVFAGASVPVPARVPADTPAYLAHLYTVPLFSAVQERSLFRLYNYVKFRAAAEHEWLRLHPPDHPSRDGHVRQLEAFQREAGEIKNRIIQANLRLVVSVAKGHAGPRTPLFELISDGNVSLMRALEKFDYSRGNRFSTYAVYVISRDYARSLPEEAHWLAQLLPTTEAASADRRLQPESQGDPLFAQAAGQLEEMLGRLSEKERSIIRFRYGLTGTDGDAAPSGPTLTLEQLGRQMGVSGERVRQIEKGALLKLRGWLDPLVALG